MKSKEIKKTINDIKNILGILITFLGILISLIEIYEEVMDLNKVIKKNSFEIDIKEEKNP